MSPHFEDKQRSKYDSHRRMPVEEGLDEHDIGLTTADVASAEAKTTRPAESRLESEPRGPISVDADPENTSLFSVEETGDFRSRWNEIQVGFVDRTAEPWKKPTRQRKASQRLARTSSGQGDQSMEAVRAKLVLRIDPRCGARKAEELSWRITGKIGRG
jgi:hypothetical protein